MNYTKQIFAYTLRELLMTRSLDNLRVAEICDACGMSRKSFYYHFRDKYDLAVYLYNMFITQQLGEYGVRDYMAELESGSPLLHYLEDSSVGVGKICYGLWRTDIMPLPCKNLMVRPSDDNTPARVREHKDIEGKKNYLRRRLREENRRLDEKIIEIAATSMSQLTYQIMHQWEISDLRTISDEEVQVLVDISRASMDMWIRFGEITK